MPVKACLGELSEQTKESLQMNAGRERFRTAICELCGQTVEVQEVKGKWTTQQHWPSVKLKRTESTRKTASAVRLGQGAAR